MKEKLPKWDLSPIYSSPEGEDFTQAIVRCEEKCHQMKADIKENASLDVVVKEYESIADTYETLNAYAYAGLSVDTTSALWLKAQAKVSQLGVLFNGVGIALKNYLFEKKDDLILKTAVGESLEKYDYVLGLLLDEQTHQMSVDNEDLAADLNRSGTEAFERLQEALASSTTISYQGKDLTVTELRNFAFDKDPEVRKSAFEAEVALLKNNETAYAAALNGVKGATITLDKRRNYGNLERSMADARIDSSVLDALIGTLEKNLPLFRSYFAAKAKRLGKKQLAFYDLFAPVSSSTMHFTFEEAKAFIIDKFTSFDSEMGAFVQQAFENNWIDAEPKKGKIGGAYDIAFPDAKCSRIMCNFDSSYSGLSTMAHELGHAFHDSQVLPLSSLLRTYPMTLAETASIFSEYLTLQGALDQATTDQRLSLVEQFIQDAAQICVDILCRFYFERALFEERKDGDLTAERMSALMVECQKKTYGELSAYHPYMWAVKGHYYSSAFSFYNYPYAFGQLFALGVYSQREKLGKEFPAVYKKMLASTGLNDCRTVAQLVDCDLTDPHFWQSGVDLIASYIKEFADAN